MTYIHRANDHGQWIKDYRAASPPRHLNVDNS